MDEKQMCILEFVKKNVLSVIELEQYKSLLIISGHVSSPMKMLVFHNAKFFHIVYSKESTGLF